MDEARDLVGKVKILNLETDKNKFDWDLEISISKWLPSCGSWTGSLRKTVNVFSWTFNRPWFGHRSKSKGNT